MRIRKALDTPAIFKADGEAGSVSAVISTFGIVDRDNDVVLASAFFDGQEVAICWGHDWTTIVGKGVITVQPDRAVFDGAFLLNTRAGKEAYETVKGLGKLQQWSWGFAVLDASYEMRDGKSVRVIKQTEVFEVSPVLIGAGMGTHTLAIKAANVNAKAAVPFKATAKAPEDEAWSKPALKDFTEKTWGDLTDAEKNGIAAHFAWSANMPPETFGDMKLPHHNPSGQVVWNGVAACAARMNQSDIPAGDMATVAKHIAGHYEQFDRDVPQSMMDMMGGKSAKAADFNTTRAQLQVQDDLWDLRWELESALRDSLESILSDEALDTPSKLAMIRTSVGQYGEAMVNWASQAIAVTATSRAAINLYGLESANHKGQPYTDHAEHVLANVQALATRSKSLAEIRAKEGRTLSSANREKLASLMEALNSVAGTISELLDATAPKQPDKGIDLGYLERRLRASTLLLATLN